MYVKDFFNIWMNCLHLCSEKIVLKVQLTLPLLQTTYQIGDRYLGEIYHEVYDTNNVAKYICKL